MQESAGALLGGMNFTEILGVTLVSLVLFVLIVVLPWTVWRTRVCLRRMQRLMQLQNRILVQLARHSGAVKTPPRPRTSAAAEPEAPQSSEAVEGAFPGSVTMDALDKRW